MAPEAGHGCAPWATPCSTHRDGRHTVRLHLGRDTGLLRLLLRLQSGLEGNLSLTLRLGQGHPDLGLDELDLIGFRGGDLGRWGPWG